MKKTIGTVILTVMLTLAVLLLSGQGRDDWRYGGTIKGKIHLTDSLTVEKKAQFDLQIIGNALIRGTNSFVTTATTDTVIFATGGVIMVCANQIGAATDTVAAIQVKLLNANSADADTAIFQRIAAQAEAGASYGYIVMY